MSVTNLSAHSMGGGGGDQEVVHTAEYLSWRKLHLAKSKLSNVCEMASFMAGFAVVRKYSLVHLFSNYFTAYLVVTICYVF